MTANLTKRTPSFKPARKEIDGEWDGNSYRQIENGLTVFYINAKVSGFERCLVIWKKSDDKTDK